MDQRANEITYRPACENDETDILNVLEEVASEVPVRLDGAERQDRIRTIIVERRRGGKSWVAIDKSGNVVGFVLARPDVIEGQAAVFVDYVGVSAGLRRSGVFSALMEKLKAVGIVITADVLHANRAGMANTLTKMGFSAVESDAQKTRFQWAPPATRREQAPHETGAH
ncbi:GNAT family N-acetyltransferase [Bradyrhizobium sp. SZCCHNR3013]|uniref:GNAT family N-acetyltransferase n=1 Tax=unclassified Bradyrhizobium TaxID=2631580 RepID=UPI003967DC59